MREFLCPHSSGKNRRLKVLSRCLAATVMGILGASEARAQALNGTVSFIPIDTNAYGVNDLNTVAITRNNLVTIGGYQFTAYYKYISKSSASVVVGRRATGSSTWSLTTTPYTLTNSADSLISGAIDDHDIVAMAVAGDGSMHLSWGMHNNTLNYSMTSNSVLGATFAPTFVQQTAANNPNLFSAITASGINQITYPEFYYTPNASGAPNGNLVFDYRNAASASGGGSGNGNTFWGTYNATTHSHTAPGQVLNGGITSVNGYQNNLTYDSAGNLLMTWTWRGSSNWQTNQSILYAQSPDNGATWYRQGGTTAYTTPIISSTANGGTAAQVAQSVFNIAQNSSLINTAGMTTDANNNPIIATWFAPNSNASLPVSATNNPNKQYMLVYYDGSQWRTSQISKRTSDPSFDTGGSFVRDMARPLVMTDAQGRVLVVTRAEDTGQGAWKNSGAAGNNIVVYWNTVNSLQSASPLPWQSVALDSGNMGEWEPTYDPTLWKSSNILSLFYQKSGQGQSTSAASVLNWDEQTYFANYTPTAYFWDASTGTAGVQDGSATWNLANKNFSDGITNYVWTNGSGLTIGVGAGAAGSISLAQNVTASGLTFGAATSGAYTVTTPSSSAITLGTGSGATIQVDANATISARVISAGGTINKRGTGTLTLSGTNTFTGTLNLGSGATAGGNANGAIRVTTAAALGGVTTINFPDNNTAASYFQLDGSGGNITLPSTVNFTMCANTSTDYINTIQNIAGNNIINGTITPNVGGNQYAFKSDAGSLTITSNFNLATLGSTRTLNLQGAGNGTLSGILGNGSGGGFLAINKTGNGTWTFSNTNTATGAIAVNGGILAVAQAGSIASPTITVASGATLNALGALSAGTGVTVTTAGTVNIGPGVGTTTATGQRRRTLGTLTVQSGGLATLQSATTHGSRTLLELSTFTNAGKVDIGDNDLLIHNANATVLANVVNQIKTGRNVTSGGGFDGNWNGTSGLVSSTVSASLAANGIEDRSIGYIFVSDYFFGGLTSFDGVAVTSTDLIVKYTRNGDADLSGIVDDNDVALVGAFYKDGITTHHWYDGDFDGNGKVDDNDVAVLGTFYDLGQPALTTSALNASYGPAFTAAFVAGLSQNLTTAVPEPSSLGLLLMAGIAMVTRRNRRAEPTPESR